MPPTDRIRNVAVGLVVRDGHALVEIYPATALHAEFARALGGGIEYGETAADAVRREFVQELGIELTGARLLAVTENIFDAGWARGHEVVHVFAVTSAAFDDLPLDVESPVLDNHTTARWVALDSLEASTPPFHPHGVADIALQLQLAQDVSPSARPGHESTG